MKKTSTKTAAKSTSTKTTQPIGLDANTIAASAMQAESDGRWGVAADLWTQVADNTQGKTKSRAAGRAAAAKVRAEAQAESEQPATETIASERPAETDLKRDQEEPAPTQEPALDAPPADPATEAPAPAVDAATATEGAAPAAPAKRARKVPVVKAPRTRDPRLPAPGTPLVHKVRGEVKAEAVEMVTGEFICAGQSHASIHKAAFAAQQALGLKNTGANGFRFFGLDQRSTTARKPRAAKAPVSAIAKSWSRYAKAAAEAITAAGEDATARAQVATALLEHTNALAQLAAMVSLPAAA